jgi:hypothetical protein
MLMMKIIWLRLEIWLPVEECRPYSKSKTWKLLSENPVIQTTEVETEGDHS